MSVEQEAAVLARVPTFAKLDPARLKLLAFTSRALRFDPGDMLIRAGDPSDSAFVILEGTVEFLGGAGDDEFVIGTAGPHLMIGEMGVIMNAPRTINVRARDHVRVLRITAPVFLKLLSENPERYRDAAIAAGAYFAAYVPLSKGNLSSAASGATIAGGVALLFGFLGLFAGDTFAAIWNFAAGAMFGLAGMQIKKLG